MPSTAYTDTQCWLQLMKSYLIWPLIAILPTPRRDFFNSANSQCNLKKVRNRATTLGPLLFCLLILNHLRSPLAFGYLDVITIGGESEVVEADVDSIERGCSSLGLTLNRTKCELIVTD